MKKTLLASAIALTMGGTVSVQAQKITITSMNYGVGSGASGTMNSNGNGFMTSTTTFIGSHWTADQVVWFDTHSSPITWAGTGTANDTANAYGNFSYTTQLTGNQVAAGIFWDWSGNDNIPILTIYDCPVSGGGACTGNSLPANTQPILGQTVSFNGSTFDDFPVSGSAVPVPAAVWLMGSGLLGLVGVARRKKV